MLDNDKILKVFNYAKNKFINVEERKRLEKKLSDNLPYKLMEFYFDVTGEKTKEIVVFASEKEIIASTITDTFRIGYKTFLKNINFPNVEGGSFGYAVEKINPSSQKGLYTIIKRCRKRGIIDAIVNYVSHLSRVSYLSGKNAKRAYDYLNVKSEGIKYKTNIKNNELLNKRDLEKLAKDISSYIKRIKEIKEEEVEIDYNEKEKIFISSEGTEIIYDPMTSLDIKIKGKVETKEGNLLLIEKIREKNLEDVVKNNKIGKALKNLERRINNLKKSKDLFPGEYPIVFLDTGFGAAIHEAGAAHLLSLRFINDELQGSYLINEIGTKIANKYLTIISDPLYPKKGNWGYYNIDDEGVEAKRIVLIERGVLKNLLVDRRNRDKLKIVENMELPLNGHARVEDITKEPEPRISNLIVKWEGKLKTKEEFFNDVIKELKRKNKKYCLLVKISSGEVVLSEDESEEILDTERKIKATCFLYPSEVYVLDQQKIFFQLFQI